METSFQLVTIFKNVSPAEIYEAWLDSEKHSAMTGSEAECNAAIGAYFSAWDGYINGKNLSFKPNEEIVQSWRTAEFDDNDDNSILVIRLRALENGTELTLRHSQLPERQVDQYKEGWVEHYFNPMKSYFEGE